MSNSIWFECFRPWDGFEWNRTGRSSSIPGLWKEWRENTTAIGVKNGFQRGLASLTPLRFVPTERAGLTEWCIVRKSLASKLDIDQTDAITKQWSNLFENSTKLKAYISSMGVFKNLLTLKMHAVSRQKYLPSNENASHSTFQTTYQHKSGAWKQTREEMP
jgi:hypothetical protein